MITTRQFIDELQSRLNQFSGEINGRKFEYLIHSNDADYEHSFDGSQRSLSTLYINGILLEMSSTPLPLRGLGSVLLSQQLTFLVPTDTTLTSGKIDYALSGINAFVANVAGNAGNLTDAEGNTYAYVMSVSTPYVGAETLNGEIGMCVPATLNVSWQLILNGVLANNVTITIRAKDSDWKTSAFALMDGAFVRTRVGEASNVDGSEELQTTVTQQGLTLKTVMPYKRKDASAYLYADMLKGDLKRIYVVTYTDSVSNGDGGISATWNMVAREITASLTAGLGITVSATFEIAREEEVSNG